MTTFPRFPRKRSSFTLALVAIAAIAGVPAAALAEAPAGWHLAGSKPKAYDTGVETGAHHGRPAAFLKSIEPEPKGFGTLMQTIAAVEYRGQRVRLSADVKATDVKSWAGLWMRVDAKDRSGIAFDNMQDRRIAGTTDWARYEVVLYVAPAAEHVAFGVLLSETGQVQIANVRLEAVPTTVATTGKPTPTYGTRPQNLSFVD